MGALMLTAWMCGNERKTFRLDVMRGKALLKVLSDAVNVKMNVVLMYPRDLFLSNHLLTVLDFTVVSLKKLFNRHFLSFHLVL